MLKAIVADINTVDEGLRQFYVEKDGKFFLNVTPVDGYELDNVSGLKSALGAERNLKRGLEDALKPFEGIDPSLARQAIDRVAAFGDITPEAAQSAIETAAKLTAFDPQKEADKIADEKFTALKTQLTSQFTLRETELQTQMKSKEGTIDSLTGQLKTLLKDNEVKSELAKLNPLEDARDAIELIAGQYIQTKVVDGKFVVEVIDANGHPRIKDALGTPVTVADLLTEIREARPALFKAEEKRGLGTTPGTTVPASPGDKNPWVKETWNLTQQMLLENTKPDLAKRFKAQAGVSD